MKMKDQLTCYLQMEEQLFAIRLEIWASSMEEINISTTFILNSTLTTFILNNNSTTLILNNIPTTFIPNNIHSQQHLFTTTFQQHSFSTTFQPHKINNEVNQLKKSLTYLFGTGHGLLANMKDK